jgi:cytoskeletal protein CcmA (bactofilin family)
MAAAISVSTQISTSQAVLGRDVTVTGEIRSQEPLIIEGEVEGTIDVAGHLLTIAPNGKVHASVQAKEVDVLGSLQGNVDGADKIYIRKGARFVGDIHSRAIVIEDGGFIRGKVDLSHKAGTAA